MKDNLVSRSHSYFVVLVGLWVYILILKCCLEYTVPPKTLSSYQQEKNGLTYSFLVSILLDFG